MSDNLSVLIAHEKILRNALNSEIDDYEDAVIDELSKNEELDYKKSKNTIYNAVEAIEIIERESNGTA